MPPRWIAILQYVFLLNQIFLGSQYQEELMELNTAAHQRPHLDLVANIQQENRQLRALETENKELKSALEEHQNTLELIMSKYGLFSFPSRLHLFLFCFVLPTRLVDQQVSVFFKKNSLFVSLNLELI